MPLSPAQGLPPPVPAPSWIFGYGSLIWRPDFPSLARQPAVLSGYRRAFCRYSLHHRGTPERPGLVIGLREGGRCVGMAYAVAAADEAAVLACLDEREGTGYLRRRLPVTLLPPGAPHAPEEARAAPTGCSAGGASVPAWVYVPNPEHPSFFGEQDPQRLVELVASGRGASGSALDYLRDLVAHLAELGVHEPALTSVLEAAQRLAAQSRV